MRKVLILAALAGTIAISACNTVAGAGKDVSSAGTAVTNTANDVKNGT
jgi:predicted small secreted protein